MQPTIRAAARHPLRYRRLQLQRNTRLFSFLLLAFFLASGQPPSLTSARRTIDQSAVLTAPVINCPSDLKHPAPAGETGTMVYYPAPTAAPAATKVSCTPASGAFFPAGTTEVKCTALNEAGSDSCVFSVTVIPRPLLLCPNELTVFTRNPAGAIVNYRAPQTSGPEVTVACAPASGAVFPVGVTMVTCAAANSAGSADCSFAVTVTPQPRCSTVCLRAAPYWLLNLHKLPRGSVQIWGVNGNLPVSTNNHAQLRFALLGAATSIGRLSPLQQFNRQYVAAQLSVLAAGGGGSPAVYNALGSSLNCYGATFAPVHLSNGALLTMDSLLTDLFTQTSLAVQQNRLADMEALAPLFQALNGADPLGLCRWPALG